MKVNPSQETAASLLSSAISRDKFQADFQASLDLAMGQQARSRRQTPVAAEAMQDALATARRQIEDYLRKGPIAHMRERLLEEMGLTEADVAAMPPEQREALEKTLAAKFKEILLAGSGIDTRSIQAQLMDLPAPVMTATRDTKAG